MFCHTLILILPLHYVRCGCGQKRLSNAPPHRLVAVMARNVFVTADFTDHTTCIYGVKVTGRYPLKSLGGVVQPTGTAVLAWSRVLHHRELRTVRFCQSSEDMNLADRADIDRPPDAQSQRRCPSRSGQGCASLPSSLDAWFMAAHGVCPLEAPPPLHAPRLR